MPRYACIILARLDSKRFPGKALVKIGASTLIEYCINSLKGIEETELILATTTREIDDPLVKVAEKNNISFFRGDTHNVAKRVMDCITSFNIPVFARVNGDSPFVRKELIGNAFRILDNPSYDFVTNLVPRTFPYGISVEVFRSKIFQKALPLFGQQKYLEHVTSFFYEHLENYNPYFLTSESGNYSNISLVVDSIGDKLKIEKLLSVIDDPNSVPLEEIIRVYQQLKL